MTVELISYVESLSEKERLAQTVSIFNSSEAELILFPGHTIGFVNDIEELEASVRNKKTLAILELRDINSFKFGNCLYKIEKGKLENMFSHQLFAESVEIENNFQLGTFLLNELETKRKIVLQEKKILILQCGEINILKNRQAKNNEVTFRLSEDKSLELRFNRLLKDSDIILNPIHTPMGNQGKMNKRREFITRHQRYYFSSSNTSTKSENLQGKSLQYAYFDSGTLVANTIELIPGRYLKQSFKLLP